MQKRVLFIAGAFLFVFATGFIILKSVKHKSGHRSVYTELLPRNAALQSAEWNLIKSKADGLIKQLKKNPTDKKSLLALTAIYVNEARITGNLAFYNRAALKTAEAVLKHEPGNFEALTFKSMILLSQHRFEEGLAVAKEAQKQYPYNAFVYGLLVDAYVELGDYAAAVEAADKMVSIRPDLRSYSRIAFLREIHGDIPGAIEAMKLAVEAGAPGDENTEWCRVQLAKLYEQTGNIQEAKMLYNLANDNRQHYAYAIAGLAGMAVAEKDYEKALSLYMQADSLIPDHVFKEGMAEVYQLMNQPDKAKDIAVKILEHLKKINGGPFSGQNEDHEMAHAYMGVGDYDKALEYALREYNRRPGNIETNETVAMVYSLMEEYDKALPYINAALKTNCKKPELLCLAGKIYARTGDKANAKMALEQALKNKPLLPADMKEESLLLLHSLQ